MDEWTRGGVGDAAGASAYLEHARACPTCRARYGALPALAARDSGLRESAPATGSDPSALADRVMAALGEGGRPGRRADRGRPYAWIIPLAAAAALAVVVGSPAFARRGIVDVRFTMRAPGATSVRLAGDFNDWTGAEMANSGGDAWVITIPLEKGRGYSYNFVIDGSEWVADPAADYALDDGFGGTVSSIVL